MKCAVSGCERNGVQVHHWAPRSIFGPTADAWPTAVLCHIHHSVWHRRVWPGRAKIRREMAARILRGNTHE